VADECYRLAAMEGAFKVLSLEVFSLRRGNQLAEPLSKQLRKLNSAAQHIRWLSMFGELQYSADLRARFEAQCRMLDVDVALLQTTGYARFGGNFVYDVKLLRKKFAPNLSSRAVQTILLLCKRTNRMLSVCHARRSAARAWASLIEVSSLRLPGLLLDFADHGTEDHQRSPVWGFCIRLCRLLAAPPSPAPLGLLHQRRLASLLSFLVRGRLRVQAERSDLPHLLLPHLAVAARHLATLPINADGELMLSMRLEKHADSSLFSSSSSSSTTSSAPPSSAPSFATSSASAGTTSRHTNVSKLAAMSAAIGPDGLGKRPARTLPFAMKATSSAAFAAITPESRGSGSSVSGGGVVSSTVAGPASSLANGSGGGGAVSQPQSHLPSAHLSVLLTSLMLIRRNRYVLLAARY
jgi:hypothetical protein